MPDDLATDATRLLHARYRGDAPEFPPQWNTTLDLLLSHRSVRAFLPDAVPAETLHGAVAAAQSASTSSNLQAWSVVAVEDPARKARLSALCGNQCHIVECPLFLVWLADLARINAIAESRQARVEGIDYLEVFLLAVVDAALAAQNAATALESMRMGTVYIGGIRNNPEKVAAELGLPPRIFPVFGMCVGTPDPARPADVKPRLPQAAVLHREQYEVAPQPEAIAAYDERLRGFQREQNMAADDWSRIVVNRVRGPESLSGRHRMREALANLGFELR